MSNKQALPVLVAGGGIGGLAAALALVRQGFHVKVFEQSPEIGEIGAGIQLGPNAFHAFDALGVGKQARSKAVYTDYMVMHDAIDEQQVGYIPTGEAFRQRFGNPYAVIHRADAHMALYDGVKASDQVSFLTSTRIVRTEQDTDSVTVHDQHGNAHHGQALIGADGVKSVVREQYVGDPAKVTGHVVYRAVVDKADFPQDLQWNAASLWAGPKCHLVHYPLRGGEQYNVVVTFHSREQEEWGVREGSREEVQSYFAGICPRARQLIELPRSWKRWATRSSALMSAAAWACPIGRAVGRSISRPSMRRCSSRPRWWGECLPRGRSYFSVRWRCCRGWACRTVPSRWRPVRFSASGWAYPSSRCWVWLRSPLI